MLMRETRTVRNVLWSAVSGFLLLACACMPLLMQTACGASGDETAEEGSTDSETSELEGAWPDGGDKTDATTYSLPYHSGETYKATNIGHVNAWDFNKGSGDADCGEPVIAVASGEIKKVSSTCDTCTDGAGNFVIIDHDADTNTSHYYHLTTVFVKVGQWVEAGQAVGTIGKTGNTWTEVQQGVYKQVCHLHFEVQNSSGAQITSSIMFRYYKSGYHQVGYLTNGYSYTSNNGGEFTSSFYRNSGWATVGSPTTPVASRVSYEGFAVYYSGGSYGNCAIYYHALGCDGGDFCPELNNTNDAWLVYGGFYIYYYGCGGPAHCWLGFPTGDDYPISGGVKQTFEYGYLSYNASNGQVSAHSY